MKKHLHSWTLIYDGTRWSRPEEHNSRKRYGRPHVKPVQARDQPEDRVRKIQQLRIAIASGSFSVSAEALADKMLAALR
jgi:anti-sigma28 factor (negative regulator of flagellin synthesis)